MKKRMARPDNVVPLRPRKRPRRQFDPRAPRTQVLIVHTLTAATFALHFISAGPLRYLAVALGVAAIAIAATRRTEGMPWACTHHEFALRTLLIGGIAWLLALLAGVVPVIGAYSGIAILVICAWVALRVVWGFGRGVLRLPILRPRTPLL